MKGLLPPSQIPLRFPPNRESQSIVAIGRRQGAFSLLEMIVVMLVMAVLALLLLGGVQAALRSTRQAKCTSNLRTIGQALHRYIQDNDMRLPPANSGKGWTLWTSYWYTPTANQYLDVSPVAYVGGREAMAELVVCPEQRRPSMPTSINGTGIGNKLGFPYVANYSVMPTSSGGNPPRRIIEFPKPSIIFWIADSVPDSGWGLGANSRTRIGGIHRGLANILWLDGHVSPEKPINLMGWNFVP